MQNLFEGFGISKEGITSLSPREAFLLIQKGALYVDLRDTDFSDFKIPDVPDIFLLPQKMLKTAFNKLPADRHLILADSSGLHSKAAVKFLKENGYEKVAHLAGGFVEWERDGFPVRVDVNERLSGACACQLKPRERGQ